MSTYEFGQLKTYKTRRGQEKTVDLYDARGREKHHFWRDVHGNLDLATPAISQSWDNAGRLRSISNKFSLIEYVYDDAGGVRTERTTVAGSGGPNEVRYCRNPNGEVSRITYPNGTPVDRFYTARGQLKDVGWGAGATSYVYWPDGKVNYQARTNGVTTNYGYDARGMISWVQHRKDSGSHDLVKRDYWRDNRDRIVAWKRGTDAVLNQMEDGRGNRYKYYDDGQLERAWYRAETPQDTPLNPTRGDHFYYDALGNRTGLNEVASRGPMLFQGKNNGLNQYFSWNNSYPVGEPGHWGTTTNYDDDVRGDWGAPGAANGVLMQDGYLTAGYNALNQPVMMWGKVYDGTTNLMWFGYDPLGRLVKRWKSSSGDPNTTTATFFYYDGTDLVQEGPGAAIASNLYVHGGRIDEIVASQVSGVWYNHHYDAQGNCILLSNYVGGIEQQYDYDAFGFPYFYTASGSKSGSLKTRFLFTGREWIVDMRVYDFRARLYQPELGRFLQPDPVEFAASDYNLYRYCHNDPVNNSDPTGTIERELEARMWTQHCFFDSGSSFQGSLNDATSRYQALAAGGVGKSRSIDRGQLEHEMSPNSPLSGSAKKNLDRGCIGLTAEYQGLNQEYPEKAPGTKAYLSEADARARDPGAGAHNFVFAKQALWAKGEPTPNKKTGEIPVNSLVGGTHFNYITYFPQTRSYAWMNNELSSRREQKATISWTPYNHPIYPTVWYSTPTHD